MILDDYARRRLRWKKREREGQIEAERETEFSEMPAEGGTPFRSAPLRRAPLKLDIPPARPLLRRPAYVAIRVVYCVVAHTLLYLSIACRTEATVSGWAMWMAGSVAGLAALYGVLALLYRVFMNLRPERRG